MYYELINSVIPKNRKFQMAFRPGAKSMIHYFIPHLMRKHWVTESLFTKNHSFHQFLFKQYFSNVKKERKSCFHQKQIARKLTLGTRMPFLVNPYRYLPIFIECPISPVVCFLFFFHSQHKILNIEDIHITCSCVQLSIGQ